MNVPVAGDGPDNASAIIVISAQVLAAPASAAAQVAHAAAARW